MESGLQFDFSYESGTSWEQMVAFETAGMMWSDYITDNMTVNIHVEMTNVLPDNVIGGALPGMITDYNYGDFREFYEADITSNSDRESFDSLSIVHENGHEKFDARINLGTEVYQENSGNLDLTRANAKALGIIAGDDSSLDGYILMNDLKSTDAEWNYDSNNAEIGNSLDFLSVAVHEVGHVLGFVSGLDKYDAFRFADRESLMNYFDNDLDVLDDYVEVVADRANPLDLFRYSADSLAMSESHNIIEMSVGADAYFGKASLDYQYATGSDTDLGGDGFQASHWKQVDNNDEIQGIMDPLMRQGMIRRISDRDLTALDAIGYDLHYKARNLQGLGRYNNLGTSMLTHQRLTPGYQPNHGVGTEIGTLAQAATENIARSLHNWANNSTLDWWIDNGAAYAGVLTENSTADVRAMVEQSSVYEGRRSRSGTSRSYSRQETEFWQSAYFSSFSWQEFVLEQPAASELLPIANVENDRSESTTVSANLASTNSLNTVPIANSAREQSSELLDNVAMNLLELSPESEIELIETKIDLELTESSLYSQESALEVLTMSLV